MPMNINNGFLYDFLYMGMRYTCPMVVLYFLSPIFVLMGALVSPVYAFNWTLFEKESWIFSYKIPKFCRAPTQISEVVVGFYFWLWVILHCKNSQLKLLYFSQNYYYIYYDGRLTEWLCRGLQILLGWFNSSVALHNNIFKEINPWQKLFQNLHHRIL